jgi:hypothetical protein
MVGSDVTRFPSGIWGPAPSGRCCFIPHHGTYGRRRTEMSVDGTDTCCSGRVLPHHVRDHPRWLRRGSSRGPVEARGNFNAVFFGLLALLVLPTVIYAIGVRRPESVLYFGPALLLITAFGWVFVFVTDEGLRAVFTPLSFLVTLATSTAGVIRDRV